MHELSIAVALVEQAQTIARKEHGHKISSVSVSIGVLAGVDYDALEFAFPLAVEDTMLNGATLNIEKELLKIKCSDCSKENTAHELSFKCPGCGSTMVEVSGGRDIRITAVEIEDNVQ